MTNNIKEIQEFVRHKVIMACHSDCKTYEEALKSELKIGCKVIVENEGEYTQYVIFALPFIRKNESQRIDLVDDTGEVIYGIFIDDIGEIDEIIGQPITLDRILICLQDGYCNFGTFHKNKFTFHHNLLRDKEWDLTKNALEKQPKDLQYAFAKLWGWQSDK